MSRIRPHLTYANAVATLTLFLVLGGGTALASYVVSSNSQVGPGTISGHMPPSGKHANIIANSINGKDIADRSGVDTCQSPLLAKYGPICAGTDGGSRTWQDAIVYCAKFDLRLPTLPEGYALVKNHVIAGLNFNSDDAFWTDETYYQNGLQAYVVISNFAAGTYAFGPQGVFDPAKTLCVTDPSA